jgi:hypothetical protein
MLTREFLVDLRASRRNRRYPTVDDPRRGRSAAAGSRDRPTFPSATRPLGRDVGSRGAAADPERQADRWPSWSIIGFADQTLRQVVRVGAGGSRLRIRLSNLFGTQPLARSPNRSRWTGCERVDAVPVP